MNKSYHSLSIHETGRCPTREEYQHALLYASKYCYSNRRNVRVLLCGPEMANRVLDWVDTNCNIPLHYERFKEQLDHLLLYYIAPNPSNEVLESEHLSERQCAAISRAEGDTWGDVDDFCVWTIVREHISTLYLHAAYVTSYLKNEHGMMGQVMVNQIGRRPTSFNETFPELGEFNRPILLMAHHTNPLVVKSSLSPWIGSKVEGTDAEVFRAKFVQNRLYSVDEDRNLTPIKERSDFPTHIRRMERYEGLDFANNDAQSNPDAMDYPTHDLEGNKID